MGRRSFGGGKASRSAFVVLSAIGAIALVLYSMRGEGDRKLDDNVVLPDKPGPVAADLTRAAQEADAQSQRNAHARTDPAQQPTPRELAPTAPDLGALATPPGQTSVSRASARSTEPNQPSNNDSFPALLQRAEALRDAGDLVTARTLVNEPLVNQKLAPDDADIAKSFLSELNAMIILSPQRFNADPFTRAYKVEPGNRMMNIAKQFDIPWELLGRLNGISDPNRLRAGVTLKAIQGPFHAVVSKKRFTLDLYLGAPGGPGSVYVKTFGVGLGSDSSTPTGTWLVSKGKLKNPVYYSPRGEGVIDADDPKNPLGERWIPLEGIEGNAVGQQSYGIHGTIEPDSIGKNMSLGCIRLLNHDVELLYDLLTETKSKIRVTE
jgi:hypothetical protein